MRLLLTNDDGVHAPGLHAMAVALHRNGHDVTIVAPQQEHSGASASIGALFDGTAIDVVAHRIADAEGIPTFGADAPPALCVMMAMLEVFGPRPDLVVSGINIGANTGRGVLQSGTVGAALLAQSFGLSALAMSQDHHRGEMIWATGSAVAVAAVDWLATAPRRTLLNVNVPNRSLASCKGVRWARQAAFGSNSTTMEGGAPGSIVVRITPRVVELAPDTDAHLVDEGFITLTGLVGISAEREVSQAAAPAVANALGLEGKT